MESRREFYPSLEILRGICAAEVFLWHICAHINPSFWRAWDLVWAKDILWRLSEVAVLTFMIISGFVVTNSFLYYRKTMGPLKAVPVFLSARALRIWSLSIPLALVSYGLTQHYRDWAGDDRIWKRFDDTSLLFKSALGLHREWIGTGWTLKYEILGYCILPFFLLLLVKGGIRIRAGAFVGLLVVLCLFYFNIGYGGSTTIPMMSMFAVGIAAYFFREHRPGPAFGTVLIIVGFAGMLYLGQIQTVPFDNVWGKLIACSLVFVGFLALNPQAGLAVRALLAVGASSYSLYLWHWPILFFGNFYGGQYFHGRSSASALTYPQVYFLLLVLVPAVIIVTWVSYRLMEKQARMSYVLKFWQGAKAR